MNISKTVADTAKVTINA